MFEGKWLVDNGCFHHITRNKNLFISSFFFKKKYGIVTIGDNRARLVIGNGAIDNDSHRIKDVYFVKNFSFNLLGVSQLCVIGYDVMFDKIRCIVENKVTKGIILIANTFENVYIANLHDASSQYASCIFTFHNQVILCHRHFGHATLDFISRLSKSDLVTNLPQISFQKEKLYDAYQLSKQIKSSFKNISNVTTDRCL